NQDAITVIGGPQTSIQVNSSNANAATSGRLQMIDLTKGGPLKTGGDFAVFGGQPTKPLSVQVGSTGGWDYPTPPINDPYQSSPRRLSPATRPRVHRPRTARTDVQTST